MNGVQGENGLFFKAGIDLSELESDANKAVNIVSRVAEESAKKQKQMFEKILRSSEGSLNKGLNSFGKINPEMKKYIEDVQKFQNELRDVTKAQSDLDKGLKLGVITQKEYNQATQGLTVRQAELNENIRKYSDQLRNVNQIQNSASGSIRSYESQVTGLRNKFEELSESQRKNESIGGKIAAQIVDLEAKIKRSREALSSVKDPIVTTFGSVDSLNKKIATLSDSYNKLSEAKRKDPELGGKIQGEIVKIESQINAINKSNQALRSNQAIMDASNGSIDQKRLKLQQLIERYYSLNEAERQNATIGGRLAREIRALDKEVNKLSGSLKSASTGSKLFNQIAIATAGIFSINQAGRFATDIIRVRGEIEQLEVAFTTILKSKEKADALLAEIVQLAVNTPFKLTEVADGAKQLLAYGFAASEVKDELLAIGNVAAGTGSTFNEVAYAYGTLRSQGVAFARDIRQFTGRGIPIVEELAKQFGVTTERVNEMVSSGKVGFPEVQKAFQSLTSEGGQFFNLMQEQSKTVTGQLSNLQDSVELMFNSIGEANEGLIKDGIGGLKTLVDNYEKVVEILGLAVTLYGSYRAALLLTVAAQRVAALTSGTLTAAQVIQTAQTAILTKATALLGAAMNALPVVALASAIALITTSIYAWTQAVDGATAAAENLQKIQENSAIASEQEKNQIKELVTILKSEVTSIQQKESAYKSLQKILGPYLDGLSLEEIAAGKAERAITQYTAAIRDNVATKEAFAKYQELGKEILEIEQRGTDALGLVERFGISLRESLDFEGKSFGDAIGDLFYVDGESVIQRQLENLRIQREELQKTFDFTSQVLEESEGNQVTGFDALIKNTSHYFDTLIKIATDKAQLDQIKEGLQNQLDALAPNDPQIAKIKEQILKTNEVLSAYSLSAENKEIKDAAAERKKILDEISKLENEAFKDSFSKREQEIAATKKQFEDLRAEAEKAGLGAGVITRIDKLEEKTTGNIVYRDETETLKTELEKRKVLYRDFETYANDFGIQAAEKRYKSELDTAKTYLDLIQTEYNKLAQIDPGNRSGVQQERFEYLEKELREESRFQQQKYDDFLVQTQSYEEQRAKIIEKYALDRQKLIENGDNGYLAQLDKNHKEEINSLDDANFQKLSIYKEFFKGVEGLSVKASKQLIGDFRKTLENLRKQGRISTEFYKEMIEALDKAEYQTAQKIPQNLREISQGFRQIATEIGGANNGLGRMLNMLSNSLDRVAAIKQGIADFQEAQDSNDSIGMATSGLGIVGAWVGIISGIASAIDNSQRKQIELQKKQLELQRQIYFGELDINRLQRERALAAAEIEESTLRNLLAQRDVLKDNLDLILVDIEKIESRFGTKLSENTLNGINSYLTQNSKDFENLLLELYGQLYDTNTTKIEKGGFLGLSKQVVKIYKDLSGLSFDEIEELSLEGRLTEPAERLFQELKKLKEEGIEVENQLKEIENAMKAIFTGNQTALGIADTIVSGFQEGKRAVEDFGQDVEEILRNAILSGFKYKFLEEPLNALLEQLYQDSLSGDELTSGEIDNFQTAFGNIIEEYRKVFDDLQNSTGIDLTGQLPGSTQSNGLAGAIRRDLTEETAGELAGLWRGQFDITKRHLAIATDQLQYTVKIEQNTFNTVQELKAAVTELKNISKNTDPSNFKGLGYDEP